MAPDTEKATVPIISRISIKMLMLNPIKKIIEEDVTKLNKYANIYLSVGSPWLGTERSG
jgi:hypothetical protein